MFRRVFRCILYVYSGGVIHHVYQMHYISENEIISDIGDTTNEAYLLDEDYSSSSTWTSTPSPTASPTLPTGGDLGKCWAPFINILLLNLLIFILIIIFNLYRLSGIHYLYILRFCESEKHNILVCLYFDFYPD